MESYIKVGLESILIGIITSLLTMVLFFIPALNILVLLAPVPIIVTGVRRGIWAGMGSLVTASIIISLLIHPFLGIIVFILNLFIFLGLWVVYHKKLQMNEAVVLSAGGTLLSIFVSLQAFTWMMGESFFDFLWNNLKAFFNTNPTNINKMVEIYQKLGMLDKAYSADRLADILMGQMRELVPLLPSMLIITSLIIGGLNFLISRIVLKKLNISVPHVPSFKNWALPRGTGRGLMGLIALSIIGVWVKLPNFEIVLYTVSSIFTFIFTIQGMSVVAFFLKEKKVPGIISFIILIAAFILLSVALTFMGIFEQIFGVRRAYNMKQGS
ncbi:MAG TPA: DUF2232 domain-containing protein [Clostridia bacterium]|nr:DUF2232 domain-containing protein [Clostridia bacterium]